MRCILTTKKNQLFPPVFHKQSHGFTPNFTHACYACFPLTKVLKLLVLSGGIQRIN